MSINNKSPFNSWSTFKHKCPSSTFGNSQIMQVFSFRKPDRLSHMEKVMPGVENSFNITLALVMHHIRFPILPYCDKTVWVLVVLNRFHIPIFPFQDNTEKIRTMIVEIPVIITLNPMMNPHWIPKEDECPSNQIRVIGYSKFFCPSNLK